MTIEAAQPAFPTIWIRDVVRLPEKGPEDRLSLEPGVNLLIGAPNTGKSKWLQMLDYLLTGDKKPEEEFDVDIARKYHTIRASVVVGGAQWTVERSWRDAKLVSKVSVDGEAITLSAFTMKLLDALEIPLLHFPQGNPYGPRTWPELGWRSLFRHMYRRQGFWSDIADHQPESEQYACILQFVGLAEIVFSQDYARKVTLEKTIQQLQIRREQFVTMLQEVSRELIDEKELGVALTPDSIQTAIQRLESAIVSNQSQRSAILHELLDATTKAGPGGVSARQDAVVELGRRLAELQARDEASMASLNRTEQKRVELMAHRHLIAEEMGRMKRAVEAGSLLADLKVTHCPACDRAIEILASDNHQCYLCKRPTDAKADAEAAAKRLEFEVAQLTDELKETDELLVVLTREANSRASVHVVINDELARVRASLEPVRVAAASILPPELALLDQEAGRLQERIAQLQRIRLTLGKRESIGKEIEGISNSVADLEKSLAEHSKELDYERAADLITDGMNTYLNVINEADSKPWTQAPIEFRLHDRGFHFGIGRANWRTKLGGTLTLFFLIAYHYALMTLAGKRGHHYPGLCILDFPAQLDGVTVSDTENFVLEPFVRLMRAPGQPMRQLIAAGSSFAGMEGAHRIQLTKVWI